MIIPEGFAQASIFSGLYGDGELAVTTLGLTKFPVGDFDQGSCDDVYTAWADNIRDTVQIDDSHFDGVRLTANNGAGLEIFENLFQTAGTVAGKSPAINCATLVRKTTTHGGRHGRGRMFVLGVVDYADVASNGFIATPTQAALQVAFSGLRTDLIGFGLIPMLLHADATDPYEVSNLNVQPQLATQRRRMRP